MAIAAALLTPPAGAAIMRAEVAMYQVKLSSFPAPKLERVERIVQKHSGGQLDHTARVALLQQVLAGQAQVIARYAEEHAAHNVVAEVALQGGACAVEKA